MHPLTVAAFTAIHALCHRIELTRAETELLDVEGASLSPDVWQGTLALLGDADAAGEGASLHLGYDRLILAWLGCRDEAECRERHGLSLVDAVASDRGSLFVAARSVAGDREITTDRAQEALVLLVKVWAERAARLAGTGEDAVSVSIASFDRAVSVCPLPEETTRALWTAFIGACEVTGNRTLAGLARERLKSRRDANEDGEDGLELVVVLVCSVLWAVTHDEYVLRCEHGLDRHVARSPDAWDRIREGVAEGRIDDVPLPVESFAAWCPGPGLDADELSGCIRSCEMATLAEILATVQAVWSGEGDPDSLPPTALALVCEICRMRRIRIERDYESVPGERRNIYYELQGARRPEALERLDLTRRLNGVLARYGSVNPDLRMCVARDLAAESESRGEHDATRQHLEEVRRAAVLVDDAGRREYAQVCLALHCWQRGDLDRAAGLIAAVSSDQAADLRVSLSNAQTARDALDAAVAACRTAPDVARWAAVAHAEMVAGHSIAGERTAQALTRAYPGRSLAWTTLARVRHEHGRHRDAIEPARVAVRLAAGAPTDLALLARILARIGEDGREESLELAERVIVEMVRVGSGPVPALASMADVIGRYADCDRSSLRHALAADDLIWAQRDTHKVPPEWPGAAASRRCQIRLGSGRFALGSSRLAEVSPRASPPLLARWVVDRVDALARMVLWDRAPCREGILAPEPLSASDSPQGSSLCLSRWRSCSGTPPIRLPTPSASLRPISKFSTSPEVIQPSPCVSSNAPAPAGNRPCLRSRTRSESALVVRLRASEVAQRVLHSGEDAADTVAASRLCGSSGRADRVDPMDGRATRRSSASVRRESLGRWHSLETLSFNGARHAR